ncbi:hypothetical protein ACU4GD_16200 [Cupriavidus basilensis]
MECLQAHRVSAAVAHERAGRRQLGPSMYLRSKGDGERVVREQRAWTGRSFRPVGGVRSARIISLNLVRAACSDMAPVVPLACADANFQPVYVDDVAAGASSMRSNGRAGYDPARAYRRWSGPQRLHRWRSWCAMPAAPAAIRARSCTLPEGAARACRRRMLEHLPGARR